MGRGIQGAPVLDHALGAFTDGSHSVSFGNNTVECTSITDQLLMDMADTKQATLNFIQTYSNTMNEAAGEIFDFDTSIAAGGFMCRSTAGGGTGIPIPIHGRILPYHIGRIHPNNRQNLIVEQLPGRKICEIERAALERL
jgi:hypothetical protein